MCIKLLGGGRSKLLEIVNKPYCNYLYNKICLKQTKSDTCTSCSVNKNCFLSDFPSKTFN